MGKNKGKQFNASKRCTLANMLMGKAKVAAIARKHKKRTFLPAVKPKQSFFTKIIKL